MMIRDRKSLTSGHKLALAGLGMLFLISTILLLHRPRAASVPLPTADAVVPPSIHPVASEAPDLASVPGTSDSWWGAVEAGLERSEYLASTTQDGLLQAPNRAQNLRTTFAEHGIAVVPRTHREVEPAWRFAWQTTGIGRQGRMHEVAAVAPEAGGSRVSYRRDGFEEWYVNS